MRRPERKIFLYGFADFDSHKMSFAALQRDPVPQYVPRVLTGGQKSKVPLWVVLAWVARELGSRGRNLEPGTD